MRGAKVETQPETPVEPFTDLMWAWNGFWRLSNSRPVGFDGVLRIPLSEIEAYGRLQGFDYIQRIDFLYFMERLDNTYMEYIAHQRELAEQRNKNKSREKGKSARRRR